MATRKLPPDEPDRGPSGEARSRRPLSGIGRAVRSGPLPKITEGTLWMLGNGTGLTTAEYLRQFGRDLPAAFRTRLAVLAFDHLIDESPLHESPGQAPAMVPEPGQTKKKSDLPPETLIALQASLMLQRLQAPDFYAELRDNLRTAREAFDSWPAHRNPAAEEAPDLTAYGLVDHDLAALERQVRALESIVEDIGYRWSWQKGGLERATGARPRQLLRDLVRALILYHLASANTNELREKIASDLAPFFPADHLITSRNSPLYNAVDSALRGR